MKFLLHKLLLLKIEKKTQKLLKKNNFLASNTNIHQSYQNWKFVDFQYLSIIIENHTPEKYKISASTLLRIFEKKDHKKKYLLKPKTKNVILSFLEYDTWENLEKYLLDLIIENINLDETLRNQISQTIAKKMI